MSMATRTDTRLPAPHVADSHDLIRVHGARVNNLKDVSIEIPKRRLTVFTGISGSGKSSLVFGTIAAESQRLINETYSAFVQGFMPTLARPEVDVLEGLTTAIIVDQERMGADARSTVGTATDANAMLRILFSRLGQPHIGSPSAFSFNVASVRASGAITVERGASKTVRQTFSRLGGMCPRCEGRGSVTDFDRSQLYDDSKSINEGALTIPGYSVDGWYGRIFSGCGFFDPDKPIREFTKTELHDLLYKEPTRIKVDNINLTYEGLIPRIQKSFLSKDREAMQPHVRAFVDRAITFTACPDCGGTRLSEAARSSKIKGISIAGACAMQISELAGWVSRLDEPSVAPLLETLGQTLDSFVEIGLGYLSLDRPSGTLSGGEAQRTKMIRHLGSSLTDVTYVFDEPTIGLHPHDIQRMNELLLQLRDKGNTVLVVEHKPEAIAIAEHVVDLGPGAGRAGHRDVAVDRSFDARAERLRVYEDDQVELEPLRQFRGQRPDAGRRGEGGIADDAGDAVGMRGEPRIHDRGQVRGRSVHDGDSAAADGDRHVGVREHGPDDRLGFRHDLFRRPVVDAQGSQADLAGPDPLEPFPPRLGEAVPGLGAVPEDGEAPGRAAQQQHLPLRVGQFLSLVHDDVRERAREQVPAAAGQRGLVDQGVLEVLAAQHRHQADAVLVVGRLDQVVDDPRHLLAFGGDRGVMPVLAS
jgi:energy-coupling factor transporter ATP-binding protein EcfA2